MGIEIRQDDHSLQAGNMQNFSMLLRETQRMSPTDLKQFFEVLFGRMSNASKEAITEIMWRGLSQSEQQAFQMPYFGHRWSRQSLDSAFHNAFLDELQADSRRSYSDGTHVVPQSQREEQLLEDHFFSILRDAIQRADQRPRTITLRRTREDDHFQHFPSLPTEP